jgi:hypothetical protein
MGNLRIYAEEVRPIWLILMKTVLPLPEGKMEENAPNAGKR